MSGKNAITFSIALAAIGVIVWLAAQPREPKYQGKGLSTWLKDLRRWTGDTNDPAILAFRAMGTSAVPALIKAVESQGSPIEKGIWEFNRKQSIIDFPITAPWLHEMAASSALCALGTNARPAFPTLTNWLFHTKHLFTGGIVLAGIGSEGIAVLLTALTNESWRIRYAAVSSLGSARSDFEMIIPALISSLEDQHHLVRCGAAEALGQSHRAPGLVVPALIKHFSDDDHLLRMIVLNSLSQFGSDARDAIPTIMVGLKDSDSSIHDCALAALIQVDPATAEKLKLRRTTQ